jgi:hypothetical protein
MAIQFSVEVRNAMLNGIESSIGSSPILKIRTGAKPANTAAADTGTVLATLNLPADFMASASGGTVAKSGTWQDLSADATGTVGHFRIYNNSETICHIQGSITATGGGGEMTVDNTNLVTGQTFTVTGFSIADANG